MQETKKHQCQVHFKVINLQSTSRKDINDNGKYWLIQNSERAIITTKTSVLEKQRTITPTNFVNVIPLQIYVKDLYICY